MNGDLQLPPGFSGVVRLFPLPNLVLFPGVIQPLHVFEERYRQMTLDAIAGDQLIAIAALQPGWELDYEHAPPVYPAICIGRIMAHSVLDDGRINLLLQGMCRATIRRELTSSTLLYRQAVATVLADRWVESHDSPQQCAARLKESFAAYCRQNACVESEAVQSLFEREMPLVQLIDLIAFVLDADLSVKLQILHTEDVRVRLRMVTDLLERQAASPALAHDGHGGWGYPPAFSSN